MDTPTLKQILIEEAAKYAGNGLNAHSVFTTNDAEETYSVIDFATVRGKRIVYAALVARLIENKIVIDVDVNDKPLIDALTARGVPDEQIMLAYQQDKVALAD